MFYADWCPFCQKFKLTFDSFANTTDKKIKFYAHMINDDDDPLWDRFSINTVPTLCLLYTSPSPRDRQKSRMPSSA